MIRILVADDNEVVRHGLKQLLSQHAGWEILAKRLMVRRRLKKRVAFLPTSWCWTSQCLFSTV